jgi:hypothetical protein
MNHSNSKLTGGRAAKSRSQDLTCNEGQVEDLLSEGESTEVESEDEQTSEESTGQNASSRKTASPNLHGRRET